MTQPISGAEAEVLELFHDAVFVRDMAGKIHFWNAASASLYGWPSDKAVGVEVRALLKCEAKSHHVDPYKQVMAEGHWQGEMYRTTRSGKRCLVKARWSLRRDKEGNAVGILDSAHDISEAELRAKEVEYRYRNLFQAMAASFWELDFTEVGTKLRALLATGVKDLETYFLEHPEVVRDYLQHTRILDLNDHSIRLFGRGDREEMLGTVDRYWPDASIQVYARCIVKSLARLPNNIEVTRLKTLDGKELECLFTACFSKENVARGVILIGIIDLSEQVAARHALEVMQTELAHAARISILGELSASIAHEINQPLAAISTYAEAALRWLLRPEPDLREVEIALRHIIDDTQRTTDVVGRIRAMALLRPTEDSELAINDVIQESVEFIRHELQKNAVHLTLNLGRSLPCIRADRVLIQQVIVNLVMNAIQAMALTNSTKRTLNIRSKRVRETEIQILVQDSGPGIAPANLQKLFESFFTTKATGMGMGLPICRSIVEAVGGSITLANRQDGEQGAEITLVFPAQPVVPIGATVTGSSSQT